MFVTQTEIDSRLKSDDNLLHTLLKDSPVDSIAENVSEDKGEKNLDQSDKNEDNDKFSAILNSFEQESRTREIEFGLRDKPGRPKDSINRSTEQRADLALMGSVLGHGLASQVLGLSTASSSLHLRGKVNHNDEEDKDLVKEVRSKLNRVRHKTAAALLKTLDIIDEKELIHKINSGKEAVFIANSLAGIIQKTAPREDDIKPTAQFIIMQPVPKTIEQYEVIDAIPA